MLVIDVESEKTSDLDSATALSQEGPCVINGHRRELIHVQPEAGRGLNSSKRDGGKKRYNNIY